MDEIYYPFLIFTKGALREEMHGGKHHRFVPCLQVPSRLNGLQIHARSRNSQVTLDDVDV